MRLPLFGQFTVVLATILGLFAAAGCAGTNERVVRRDLSSVAERFASPVEQAPAAPEDTFERGLSGYVAYAMSNSPELRASFERWQASVYRISRARRLPEPTLSFGGFVQSVETRVGPQLARVGLQQTFPWPTKLSAGADAASAKARASERRFDAEALVLKQRISELYWQLWFIRRTRDIHVEHLTVLQSLSASVLARVSTGTATLADQQQIDLSAARLEDQLRGLDEAERAAAAQLRAAVGAPVSTAVPTPGDPPEAVLPLESEETLAAAAASHPLIASFDFLARAEASVARSEEAERYPGFSLGVDWIITGKTDMPDVADSGKDAVILGAGIRLPLWQGSYKDSIAAANAEANARRAEGRAAKDNALAALEAELSAVRDGVRRVSLFRDTLVPQAESAYESVTGAYITGRGSVAQTLLAQRDLLDLRNELERTRAGYAKSWARLEQIVGRELERRESLEKVATGKDMNDEGR